ncbi:DUF3114 domain-containing protein [Candidatus Enterococcus clewellii]|uniref:DUF3114 domain-containing protein n=1 Tax=Candidatus Enterococcus clewellii TaxID=1834193 RepID=A0A242KDV6_9ENTE|nr:DUF3114 domain-containing protein [Enterococcus sp. 9E7_DIV0242]OTP19355.1 hypothetical protein A5888_001172 [Enterococcus sp. 9E7_DIV0242]
MTKYVLREQQEKNNGQLSACVAVLSQKAQSGETLDLQEQLLAHESCLSEMDWDPLAVAAYDQYLAKQLEPITDLASLIEMFQSTELQLQKVGSPLYEQLFTAWGRDELEKLTEVQAKKRLQLLLKHLGGEIDENGMLQLLGARSFDECLAPHATFWRTVAKTVQLAYPFKELTNRSIHQLRMYIDRQNIQYIRTHFKKTDMTDEQALAAYVKAPAPFGLAGRRLEREPARYHNKLITGEAYQDRVKGNENKKRTVYFHSEFILDRKGSFVSQWNVLKENSEAGGYHSDLQYYQQHFRNRAAYFEAQLMNGESFNYATRNDEIHKQLDIRPPGKLDPTLRKEVGRHGLYGTCDEIVSLKERKATGASRKWITPEQKNEQTPELNYDYFSDKGDNYSGRLFERFLDVIWRIKHLFRRK